MEKLENYGVQELNTKEIIEIDGGGWIADFTHWVVHTDWTKYPSGYVHSQYGI